MHPGPVFPKLGLGDDRRETLIVSKRSKNLKSKRRLIALHLGVAMLYPSALRASGLTSPSVLHSVAYAIGTEAKTDLATSIHENHHLMMNRVEALYGQRARNALSAYLFESMADDSKEHFFNWYRDVHPRGSKNPEEHVASLLDWHNDPEIRGLNYSVSSADPDPRYLDYFLTHHKAMKAGLKAVLRTALDVTPKELRAMARSRKR